MHFSANKLLIEYKTDVQVLKEQIRTMNLKLDEVVEEVYRNLAPQIESAVSTLSVEMVKAKKENIKLQVQVDSLLEEEEKIEETIGRHRKRLEVLEDLIGN